MSGTQDWLLSRCEAEARSSSGHLVELLTVQSVVAECVEDVVEAFRCNELAAARREVEVVRLEAEVAALGAKLAGRAATLETERRHRRAAEDALRSACGSKVGTTVVRLGALTDDAGGVPLEFGSGDRQLVDRVSGDSGDGVAASEPPLVSRNDAARLLSGSA